MIQSIELQMISKILTSEDEAEIDALCDFDSSYYSVYKKQIEFILDHKDRYGNVPDVFTFQAQFVDDDITLIDVTEPVEFLIDGIKKNKQYIIFLETFNNIQDLGQGDITEAWEYIGNQYDNAMKLTTVEPMNIIKQAEERANNIIEFNNQTRIPTGFPEIDKLMYGGLSTVEEYLLIIARTNTGKAQPLWSKVLTPNGWTTMGELKIGDEVVGENNDNGKVVKIFPQGVKDYYRVTFDDGTSTECCRDHLWKVSELANPGDYQVLTLDEIISNYDIRYAVDITEPITFRQPFDINSTCLDTYLLGAVLVLDTETKMKMVSENLLDSNLVHVASLPAQYLTASTYERKFLLAGVSDALGSVSAKYANTWEMTMPSEKLAQSIAELARSLGVKVKIDDNHLICTSTFNPFWQNRESVKFRWAAKPLRKVVTSIDYIGETECQCILLNNKTHTYITDDYITTHNSWIVTRMAEAAQKAGFPVAFYSPEMRAEYLSTRFDSWRAHFKNSDLYLGKYTKEYWDYIYSLQKEATDVYIIEDKDMPDGVSTRSLGAFVKKHGIKLLIVDGLSYMVDARKSTRNYEKFQHISEDLFMLSKKYGCAVVATVQANRETKDTLDDKGEPFPSLYQVSDSDAPARIATQAFAVRQIFDQHVLDIRLEKSRNAKNEKPVHSYSWDPNTGNMQYIPSDGLSDAPSPSLPSPSTGQILGNVAVPETTGISMEDLEDEDVEF